MRDVLSAVSSQPHYRLGEETIFIFFLLELVLALAIFYSWFGVYITMYNKKKNSDHSDLKF